MNKSLPNIQISKDHQLSWKFKLIDSLGLAPYLVKKFLFRPPQISYEFVKIFDSYTFYPVINGKKIDVASALLQTQANIIQTKKCYIPLIYLHRPNFINKTPSQSVSFYSQDSRSNSIDTIIEQFQSSSGNQHKSRRKSLESSKLPKVQMDTPKTQQRILIIFSHGNASDLGDVYFFSERMVRQYDCDFLAYDYTGYGLGLNRFGISEQQTYEDLQQVLAYAVHKLHYELSQIILWGFSLGSGPTIEIATRFSQIGGMVLQAPLASVILWIDSSRDNVTSEEKDIYSNVNKIQAIKTKILIIHGESDTIINQRHSEILYSKYLQHYPESNNIWFAAVANTDHNNLQEVVENGECDLGKKIFRFLRDVDMERAFVQLSHLYSEWPQEEIFKQELKREMIIRETTLLKLLYQDQISQKESGNNKKNVDGQSLSKITPIEQLDKVVTCKNKKRSIEQKIFDYRDLINQKQKQKEKKDTVSSIITNESKISHGEKKKRRKYFFSCFCSPTFQNE